MENYIPDKIINDIAFETKYKYLKAYLNLFPLAKDYFNIEKEFSKVNRYNKFLYNGKEYINNTDLELNWYDYGARYYDPLLGRWHSVDGLAELHYNYSPYVYVYNSPVKLY